MVSARYHVVAYVKHAREPTKEPDVVVHGELDADQDAEYFDGTFKEGNLCVKPKGDAFEYPRSVDSRTYRRQPDECLWIQLSADGQASVNWQRDSPGPLRGISAPGRPFKKRFGGTTLCVETREIKRGGELTSSRIPRRALAHFTEELRDQRDRSALRDQIRTALASLDAELLETFEYACAYEEDRMRSHEARKYFAEKRRALMLSREEVRALADRLFSKDRLSEDDVASFRDITEETQAEIAGASDVFGNVAPEGFGCKGTARITAHRSDDTDKITHWSVRFENDGRKPWIGTISFSKTDKNAGHGFESMALPKRNSAAVQRIETSEWYGLVPAPGTVLRLGVRGHSWLDVPLPASGEAEYSIRDFNVESTDGGREYFDLEKVQGKRIEKFSEGRVAFFQNGKPWSLEQG